MDKPIMGKEQPKGAKERIAELEAKVPRWIPVGERLPEHGVQVLGALRGCGSGRYNISRINYNKHAEDYDWEADGFEIGYCWDVTHWMPLPEPPTGEG